MRDLNQNLMKAQIASDHAKMYEQESSYISSGKKAEFDNAYPEYNKLLASMGDAKGVYGEQATEGYPYKTKYVEAAIDLAKKTNTPVTIGYDNIRLRGFDETVPVVYFETPKGQVSFHMPDWGKLPYDPNPDIFNKPINPNDFEFNIKSTASDTGLRTYKTTIPIDYQNLFDSNYQWNGLRNSRSILESLLSTNKDTNTTVH